MRYRILDQTGDMTFGSGSNNYYIDNKQAVAQAVMTRLNLFFGEWFLDTTDGTPWYTQILNKNTKIVYDSAIKNRILGTPGLAAILSYSSQLNHVTRGLSVQCTINTIYGEVALTGSASSGINPGNLLDINFILDQSVLS